MCVPEVHCVCEPQIGPSSTRQSVKQIRIKPHVESSSTRQSSRELKSVGGVSRVSTSGVHVRPCTSGASYVASSPASNENDTKDASFAPPLKFANQIYKLRKRSRNKDNNYASTHINRIGKEKRLKRNEVQTFEIVRHTEPQTKRKYQRNGDNQDGSEAAADCHSLKQKIEVCPKTLTQEKQGDINDMNHTVATTSSEKKYRISTKTVENGNLNANKKLKNRPLLVKRINNHESGSKQASQDKIVSLCPFGLPEICSLNSTAAGIKIGTKSALPSATKKAREGSAIVNHSTKEKSLEALDIAKSSESHCTTESSTLENKFKLPSCDFLPLQSEKHESEKDVPTRGQLKTQRDIYSVAEEYSLDLSSSELLKQIESNGFDEGNISTSLYRKSFTKPKVPLTKEELSPATRCIYVRSKEDAFCPQLYESCLQRSIVVVRNLCAKDICGIDLSLFSTKKLVDQNPEHDIEIRFQVEQVSDENWDANCMNQVWYCTSSRGHTTISKYAEYQSGTIEEAFKQAAKEQIKFNVNPSSYSFAHDPNAQRRTIKFGTNCDLSDEKKWRPQLDEINKLPSWCRLVSAGNMLSHIGHQILGMNTLQLYMKVPCSRTPGHQENNNFAAVNLNIGPGDSEWFGVPNNYWSGLQDVCKKNKVDFLHGSWWPNVKQLRKMGIPVYRFMQKPGDLVWVNTGCVHWVQAAGWCNNIAWNVGPLTGTQYAAAMDRYENNKIQKYQSIVAMEFLSWNLARNIQVHETALFQDLRRTLQQSIRKIVQSLNFVRSKGCKVRFHGHRPGEPAHYCGICSEEVFNVLLIRDCEKRHIVHCLRCSKSPQIGGPDLKGIIVLIQYSLKDLLEVYDQFQLV